MKHDIKINLPGGFISAGDLYEILLIAENAGAGFMRFGNRQQLYFEAQDKNLEGMEMEMLRAGIAFEINSDNYPNIVSSYVCDTIFSNDSWLKEGVYRDILDMFNYQPRLKINLADQQQTFVPFFSGHFNFIAADTSNYWHWYVRFPGTNQLCRWPALVYSDDIVALAKIAEEVIFSQKEYFFDQQKINELLFFKTVSSKMPAAPGYDTGPLTVPAFSLPYYEGFNKYANDKYWLGIYRRNECFRIDFLKDLCSLCIKTRIGQIYTTPWKSLIIKGIEQADRAAWGGILDKYRLNVRHAANELNWQTEDLCEEGLALKLRLVREFEEADLRTYRLSFAIKTQPKTGLLGSVIIKKQSTGLFGIWHTSDFNPNNKAVILYRYGLHAGDLAHQLAALCEFYYASSLHHTLRADSIKPVELLAAKNTQPVFQCKNCQSMYDERYGDELNGIPPGTAFADTGPDYSCPVCDSAKDCFFETTAPVLITP